MTIGSPSAISVPWQVSLNTSLAVFDPMLAAGILISTIGIWVFAAGIVRIIQAFGAEGEGHRFWWVVLGLLGLIALLLASFGVCVSLSQSVVERTREIGIRVAVGALPRQVAGLVFREGVALTIVGITLGLSVATLTGGFLRRLLFEVPAIDAATLAGMAVLFSLISAVAVYVPAWRAARLDPTIALRRQ